MHILFACSLPIMIPLHNMTHLVLILRCRQGNYIHSHPRSVESAKSDRYFLLLCVFWVHWRAQWKKHYRRRRFAFVPIYVCIPCLIGLILCRAQFVSIFDFKRKRDSNPHGLWSTPAATSTHHLIIKVANFNYNSICYQDRYLRGSRLYRFVYSFLLSTEGISSRSP